MAKKNQTPALERMSTAVTRWSGQTTAFVIAVGVVLAWLATGPVFQYSDTWQLIINTGTTIVTFLMVFLIQRSQNKESLAIQLKLNELLAAIEGASNRLVDVENLNEEELHVLHTYYARLARMSASERSLTESHSIDEAASRHEWKKRSRARA
jgi:low affinity Fe/Cu permease